MHTEYSLTVGFILYNTHTMAAFSTNAAQPTPYTGMHVFRKMIQENQARIPASYRP